MPLSLMDHAMNRPTLLAVVQLTDAGREAMAEEFDLIYAPDAETHRAAVRERGGDIRIVLSNGATGLSAAEMDALPQLALVCALGVGHENIDIAHAHARGIAVGNGAGTNAACVADHAMALLLAAVRRVVHYDRLCRQGVWRAALEMPANVSGKRLGLLGLGAIGQGVARRAEGFDMQIGYTARRVHGDGRYLRFDDVRALAAWADYLVIAVPGGAATHHLVDETVLAALGPHGYVVNVSRGSVIDTAALARALGARQIAGAALDVYESEPEPPAELIGYDTLVITPHMGGWSPEAVAQSEQRFIDNARRFLAGEPLLSPL